MKGITKEWLTRIAEATVGKGDDGDIPPTGGFRDARNRTLDRLAKACKRRDVGEVQRLALMTLTWGNKKSTPLLLIEGQSDEAIYEQIKARLEEA